jgi:hypothetical protein
MIRGVPDERQSVSHICEVMTGPASAEMLGMRHVISP